MACNSLQGMKHFSVLLLVIDASPISVIFSSLTAKRLRTRDRVSRSWGAGFCTPQASLLRNPALRIKEKECRTLSRRATQFVRYERIAAVPSSHAFRCLRSCFPTPFRGASYFAKYSYRLRAPAAPPRTPGGMRWPSTGQTTGAELVCSPEDRPVKRGRRRSSRLSRRRNCG
jgi:hypothetical protein